MSKLCVHQWATTTTKARTDLGQWMDVVLMRCVKCSARMRASFVNKGRASHRLPRMSVNACDLVKDDL